MRKLLIVSDAPGLYSGQARVVREYAKRFHEKGITTVVAGWFHDVAEPQEFPYPVIAASKEHPALLADTIKAFLPDTILCIGDPWDFAWLTQFRAQVPNFQLWGHLNIEAELPTAMEQVLDGFDGIVTTSEFGLRQIARPTATCIHYGVDMKTFLPTLAPKYFMGRPKDDCFIVLVNAQNIHRKNLPVAVDAFARFAQSHDNALCYMNCTTKAPNGFDLYDQIVRMGAEKLFYFNAGNRGAHDTVDDAAMNAIYSGADALLVTSCAEGFGLPVLEAMATRTLVIAPAAYSMPELVQGRGLLYPAETTYMGVIGARVVMPGHKDITAALEQAYTEWQRRDGVRSWWDQHLNAAQAFAMCHSWDVAFNKLFITMETQPTKSPAALATGAAIDGLGRIRARRLHRAHMAPTGVLKMGGLGDMLQATRVIREDHVRTGARYVVFANQHLEIFTQLPEVLEVVQIAGGPQQDAVRSMAPAFKRFLDVRYVSMCYDPYGTPAPTEYGTQYRNFYDYWTFANARIDTLGLHTTRIMLKSLGLEAECLAPIFTPRDVDALSDPVYRREKYIVLASGAARATSLKAWDGWEELVAGLPSIAIQVGDYVDPPIPGALDARGASLAATATIMEHSQLLVSVEGGIAHLGAALGLQAVVLFGPTPVVSFGYPTHVNLSAPRCPPCFWSPTWPAAICSIGEPACVNYPSVPEVLAHVTTLYHADLVPRAELVA